MEGGHSTCDKFHIRGWKRKGVINVESKIRFMVKENSQERALNNCFLSVRIFTEILTGGRAEFIARMKGG